MRHSTNFLLLLCLCGTIVCDDGTTQKPTSFLSGLRKLAQSAKETIVTPIHHVGQAFSEVFEVLHGRDTETERDRTTHGSIKTNVEEVGRAVSDTLTGAKQTIAQAKDAALDKATDIAHAAADKVASVKDSVKDRAKAIGESAVHTVADKASAAAHGVQQAASDMAEKAYDAAAAVPRKIAEVTTEAYHVVRDKAKDTAEAATDTAAHAAEKLQHGASDVASRAAQTTKDVAQKVKEAASSTRDETAEKINELKVRAGESAKENGERIQEKMTHAMDSAKHKAAAVLQDINAAKDTGVELLHKTKEFAHDTAEKAIDAAKEKASDVAQKVKDTTGDAAQRAKEDIDQVYDHGADFATRMKDTATDAAQHTTLYAHRAEDAAARTMQDAKGKVAELGAKGANTLHKAHQQASRKASQYGQQFVDKAKDIGQEAKHNFEEHGTAQAQEPRKSTEVGAFDEDVIIEEHTIKITTIHHAKLSDSRSHSEGLGQYVHDQAVRMKERVAETVTRVANAAPSVREYATHLRDVVADKVRNLKDSSLELIQKTLERVKS